MPARNLYHDAVVAALEADGWTVTDDPLRRQYAGRDIYVDLGAEQNTLAAEKAGNWSEALTLYEQALQHSKGSGGSGLEGRAQAAGAGAAASMLDGAGRGGGGGVAGARADGLGPMQRGYLDCLLHMGHLQGLLTQASPPAVRCCAALCCAVLPRGWRGRVQKIHWAV